MNERRNSHERTNSATGSGSSSTRARRWTRRSAERLRAARERALARQQPEPAPALAWADGVLGRLGGWGGLSLRLVVPVAAAGDRPGRRSTPGSRTSARPEVEELDALLLTDDLPIDAYLDRGFQNWLKKRASQD